MVVGVCCHISSRSTWRHEKPVTSLQDLDNTHELLQILWYKLLGGVIIMLESYLNKQTQHS